MPQPTIAEFTDPRLVEIFDTVNAYDPGTQPDFYASVARQIGSRTIVELGCGTGIITVALAEQGYTMIGVEPAAAMLDVARTRSRAEHVGWITGSAAEIGTPNADMAFMAGHVAQFFVDDAEWMDALRAMHRALRTGGTLTFEARNPADRAWERWTPNDRHEVTHPHAGPVTHWSDTLAMDAGVLTYDNHYVFEATGEHLVSHAQLRFRTLTELDASLEAAGFTRTECYGNWGRAPLAPTSPEFIVVATAR